MDEVEPGVEAVELSERRSDPLLFALAAASGAVDAISLTVLGVFTAAVTANVVIVGIALGDADPHAALRAALAFAGLAAGVLIADRLLDFRGQGGGRGAIGGPGPVQRRRLPWVLAVVAAVQLVFLLAWIGCDGRPTGATLDVLALTAALAMGGQTAAARVWHPSISTTYVSGVLTLLLDDLVEKTATRRQRIRRASVILAVVAGAACSALFLGNAREWAAALPLALTLAVGVVVVARNR